MKIFAVDDEKIGLENLVEAIREAAPETEVCGFRRAGDALAAMREWPCDVAILDIRLRDELDGIGLAKQLKDVSPDVNIIFATGYQEYMKDAFDLHASGYLMKPIRPEQVKKELMELRRPVIPESAGKKRVRVQCFGGFEIFIDGRAVTDFKYKKTKELFAYLVNKHGAGVTGNEIIAALWEKDSESNKSYLRNLQADLRKTFRRYDVEDVLVFRRKFYAVNPEAFWCDYYEFTKGNAEAVNLYHGRYMEEYSWSEFMISKF